MFKFVPARLALPCEMHVDTMVGAALLQTGDHQDLLRPAFWRGLSLYVPQVQAIRKTLGIPELKRGQGSGSKGAVVKRDVVKQVIKHLFPDCNENDFWRMVNYTAPEQKRKQNENLLAHAEEFSEPLQYMVSCLDPDNVQEFKEVAKQARQDLLDKAMDQGKNVVETELKKTLISQLQEAEKKVAKYEAELNELKRDVAPHRTASSPAPAASSSRAGEVRQKVTPLEFRSLFPFARLVVQARRCQKVCEGSVSP